MEEIVRSDLGPSLPWQLGSRAGWRRASFHYHISNSILLPPEKGFTSTEIRQDVRNCVMEDLARLVPPRESQNFSPWFSWSAR